MLEALWQYFHKMDGNVCLQWTVPHPARPNNQFVQVQSEKREREGRSNREEGAAAGSNRWLAVRKGVKREG
eukprot:753270-Hanusia_phi.AAC.10